MINHAKPSRTKACLIAAACLLLVAGGIGCSSSTAVSAKEDTASAATPAAADPMRIDATPELLERIEIGQAQWAPVGARINVAAHVDLDETRVTRVGSPVMGRVNGLAAREGQHVTRGQLLATITSTGLSDAQLTLLKALSQAQLAQRAVDRAHILLDADVIGSAELQRREAELTQTQADMAVARDQLRLLGMAPEAIENLEKTRALHSVARVEATANGTVLERHVSMGQVIQSADTMFEIADLSVVWLVADVPEQSAGTLRIGQAVEATLSAFPGETLHGRLSFVAATVNPETRTVRVRMEVPNRQRRYKPSMLATMVIHDPSQRRLVVPMTAVVRDNDETYVFAQKSPKQFVLTAVKLGLEQAGKRVLEEGLDEEQPIAIDGAFHLNNERLRQLQRGTAE